MKKIIGFEFSECTIFRRISHDQMLKLEELYTASEDAFWNYAVELETAEISSTEECFAILSMREPDFKWMVERWAADGAPSADTPSTEELNSWVGKPVSPAEAKLRTKYYFDSYETFTKDLEEEDRNEEGILRLCSSDWLGRYTVEELKRDRIVYIENGFVFTRLDEMIHTALSAGCDPSEIKNMYTKDPEMIQAAEEWMAELLKEWEK